MKPAFIRQSVPNRQRGISLFITLIMLLLVTVVGTSAVTVSNMQLRLAGNAQFQSLAMERAGNALAQAEWRLSPGNQAQIPGWTAYSSVTPELYPAGYLSAHNIDSLSMTWSDSNSKQVDAGNQRYLIELLGANKSPAGSGINPSRRVSSSCSTVNLYRITARGESARAAVKFIQVVYSAFAC